MFLERYRIMFNQWFIFLILQLGNCCETRDPRHECCFWFEPLEVLNAGRNSGCLRIIYKDIQYRHEVFFRFSFSELGLWVCILYFKKHMVVMDDVCKTVKAKTWWWYYGLVSYLYLYCWFLQLIYIILYTHIY